MNGEEHDNDESQQYANNVYGERRVLSFYYSHFILSYFAWNSSLFYLFGNNVVEDNIVQNNIT